MFVSFAGAYNVLRKPSNSIAKQQNIETVIAERTVLIDEEVVEVSSDVSPFLPVKDEEPVLPNIVIVEATEKKNVQFFNVSAELDSTHFTSTTNITSNSNDISRYAIISLNFHS